MRALPTIGARQCGVFSSRQAVNAGWTKSALAHALSTGRLSAPRRGTYRAVDPTEFADLDLYEQQRWAHAAPAVAAVLTTPGGSASHSTAAVVLGLPLLFLPEAPCVTVVPWHTGEIPRVHVHRCTAEAVAFPYDPPLGQLPCHGVERTVLDIAREHGVVAGVVAADAALHERRTEVSRLETALGHCVRWPGVRAAREAVQRADGRSESPLETRSRLKIADFGLPAPSLQVDLGDALGRFIGRADFYWDEFGVVGEADGGLKYSGSDVQPLLKEKRRQERLERTGLPVVRWGTDDLADFAPTAARLRRRFRAPAPRCERGWTVLSPL